MQSSNASIPWRERALVSLDEAGQILGRSPGWVRHRVMWGALKAVRITEGGPISIAVPELIEFLASAQPVKPADFKVRPKLTIVSNT